MKDWNTIFLLKKIFLWECGVKGAVQIGEILKQNQSIQKIDLGLNKFGDEGCISICEGLKHNHVIKEIGLQDCGIRSQQYDNTRILFV